MSNITKHLGIAISDKDNGRISTDQLLKIFQEAIDNGDILERENEFYVVATVFPLLDEGLLERSQYTDIFESRMNKKALDKLAEIRKKKKT